MQAFLESFATVDEVYQECKKRGIKGEMRCANHCIIVALIHDEYPDFKGWINVYPRGVTLGGIILTEHCSYPMSKAMREFTLAFDEGQYPDLVKESTNDR